MAYRDPIHRTPVEGSLELDEIRQHLHKYKLPYQDLKLDGGITISYRNQDNQLVGSGALEFYGSSALLRSVAVDERARGKQLGQFIVDDLMERASAHGIRSIYLLTETAHDFFLKKGFKDMKREDVPHEVHQSSEFASVCPVSAACMVYDLK